MAAILHRSRVAAPVCCVAQRRPTPAGAIVCEDRVRIFALPRFSKDAAKSGVSDTALASAVARAESGLIDADLGLCLVKQRVPRPGQGRSGGFRTILFYKRGERAVFLYMFPKNARANVTPGELESLRDFAAILAGLTEEAFDRLTHEQGWKVIPDEHADENLSQ